jgi:CubicO group peptidase (beta-lactamase class C family)
MSHFQQAFTQLDSYIELQMEAANTPGMAIAFFDREQCVRVATYGFVDLQNQTLVTPDTLFEIGSITKSFTAVAVIQAVEVGLLGLHKPVTDYLPWFQVQSQFDPITIHHLLTHSAGLVGVIDSPPDIRSAVWALRETQTAWSPGSHFSYSDVGYQVLTLVLQEVTGRLFTDILQTMIFDPLGMSASAPALTHTIRPRLAQGYQYLYDDRPYHASQPLVPATWIETNSGDCCIASTAEDMTKFARMLLNQGRGPHGMLLSPASYDLLTHPYVSASWCEYGYGLMLRKHDKLTLIGHAGGMPDYKAEMLVDMDNGLGVIVLNTEPHPSGISWVVMDIWRAACLGQSLEAIDLSLPNATYVDNATDFAGTYVSGDNTLTLIAKNDELMLHYDDHQIALERRGFDQFYVNHPHFDRFLLTFGRAATNDSTLGAVVETYYGADWYINGAYIGPRMFDYPPEWDGFPGHYRSHNPWQTNFRVILRKGALWLVWPSGSEEPLTPLPDGLFRVGDRLSAERLRFDQIVNGLALCANLAACDYYRFFTP